MQVLDNEQRTSELVSRVIAPVSGSGDVKIED